MPGRILDTEASHGESRLLCSTLRDSGSIERLVALLSERTGREVLTRCLLVIGNLASSAVDSEAHATKERIREVNGVRAVVQHLGSGDHETLFYACGACMNCCTAVGDVAVLKETGAFSRLVQLSHGADERLASYARGCLECANGQLRMRSFGRAASNHAPVTRPLPTTRPS